MDDATLQRMISAARRAQRRAHAPYSNFHVGAAILTDRNRIIAGCNVENASYGLTMCAERVAIGALVAQDAGRPIVCVVVGNTDEPLTPCGACRQVLYEFNREMQVICIDKRGNRKDFTTRELLPGAFGSEALDKEG